MKIFILTFFSLFKQRIARLAARTSKKEEAAPVSDPVHNPAAYTMVDQMRGGRKLNLLMSGYVDGTMIDQARLGNKTCKARWHKNNNEQVYKPRELKIDPQLEFYYEEFRLDRNADQTVIGS